MKSGDQDPVSPNQFKHEYIDLSLPEVINMLYLLIISIHYSADR